jgi:hypothetical protein
MSSPFARHGHIARIDPHTGEHSDSPCPDETQVSCDNTFNAVARIVLIVLPWTGEQSRQEPRLAIHDGHSEDRL